MKIDLHTLKTYWINMSKDVDKHQRMKNMFMELQMSNTEHFEGIVLDPNSHIKDGSGMATHTLLTKILEENQFPCLVLEDDAKNTKFFKYEYDVPDACDALYLGVSKAGARGHPTLATKYDECFLKVWNMLATHAVVYFNKFYVETLLRRGDVYLNSNIPYDIAIAEIHSDFCVLTPFAPAFYQYDPDKKSKFNVEYYTRDPIVPLDSNIKQIEFSSESRFMNI
jgi:hypothetical protein